ncbi:hypothetical protein SAMN05216582_13723 [Selenomonas ruminantium]|uniref:Uncharacterized protein n=1 Tax=Selenomonas ruminantium TaxID=971 RepID=A0A1M6XIH0_SELRU|nr:hypothetical protein [Selenomonas ruminantium]SHL05767.1 hypothetical protein SAMN05216582_13723 [Selenomonas ruminantium]
MKRLILTIIAILMMVNLSYVSANNKLVEINNNYYWCGNKNFICIPLSGGSSGRYSIIDISSIVVVENSNSNIKFTALCYGIDPSGNIENKSTFSIKRIKLPISVFKIERGVLNYGSIEITYGENTREEKLGNLYYDFIKEIEKQTNGKISSIDIFGGYVNFSSDYVWYIPNMPLEYRAKYGDGLAIIKINDISATMKDYMSTEKVISPLFYYYIFPHYSDDYVRSHLAEIHNKNEDFIITKMTFALTSNGKWIRVLSPENYAKFGGASTNNYTWEELPSGLLGKIYREVCDYTLKYLNHSISK